MTANAVHSKAWGNNEIKKYCYRYDIDWLISEINSGKTFRYETFWHEGTGFENNLFSQWADTPFIVNGRLYYTAENYMMSEKAILFRDYKMYELIMASWDPDETKRLGKRVANFDQAAWDKSFREIIFHGNLGKANGCSAFLNALLASGDAVLIEASPYDATYGAGMEAKDLLDCDGLLKVHPKDWHKKDSNKQAQNNLGFVLMGLRDMLRDMLTGGDGYVGNK